MSRPLPTLEEIKAAYAKTGLKPARGDFFQRGNRACAIGALAASNGIALHGSLVTRCLDAAAWADKQYGLEGDLFIAGFDSTVDYVSKKPAVRLGHDIAAALLGDADA